MLRINLNRLKRKAEELPAEEQAGFRAGPRTVEQIFNCRVISYMNHKTNEYVRNMTATLVGPQPPLLATVKRRKLSWFGHVTRHDSLCKTVLQGTLEGGRRRGRQRKNWMDIVKEWNPFPWMKYSQQMTQQT